MGRGRFDRCALWCVGAADLSECLPSHFFRVAFPGVLCYTQAVSNAAANSPHYSGFHHRGRGVIRLPPVMFLPLAGVNELQQPLDELFQRLALFGNQQDSEPFGGAGLFHQ